MTDRELMQEALYALTYVGNKDIYSDTIDALRARLAQPEEPDWSAAGFSKPPTHSEAWWRHEVSNAWAEGYEKGRLQREWQGLTEMEIMDICNFAKGQNGFFLVREVEAKLKEKNT